MANKRRLLDLYERAGSIATVDIEATNLAADYGRILVISVKPFGKPPKSFTARTLAEEKEMLVEAVKEINKYDCVIGHFCTYFDVPYITSRLVYHGLAHQGIQLKINDLVDTWMIARYNMKMSKNNLAALCKGFHLESEKKGLPPDEWIKVQENPDAHIDKMRKYCEQDTRATEALYKHLKPVAGNKVRSGTPYSL